MPYLLQSHSKPYLSLISSLLCFNGAVNSCPTQFSVTCMHAGIGWARAGTQCGYARSSSVRRRLTSWPGGTSSVVRTSSLSPMAKHVELGAQLWLMSAASGKSPMWPRDSSSLRAQTARSCRKGEQQRIEQLRGRGCLDACCREDAQKN